MYYPCSENKDADQLRGYREADLRLCFRICKLLVFSCTGSYANAKTQITQLCSKRLCFCYIVQFLLYLYATFQGSSLFL